MRSLDLTGLAHPNFVILYKTTVRINKAVAWVVRCKHCGVEQLAGSSQLKRGTQSRCIKCQIPKTLEPRELKQ